jgi:hypothetical protein
MVIIFCSLIGIQSQPDDQKSKRIADHFEIANPINQTVHEANPAEPVADH